MSENQVGLVDATIIALLAFLREAHIPLTDDQICLGAEFRTYNPGIEDFLKNMRLAGIQNILLSSGSKAYLERTTIAPSFDEIHASTMTYSDQGEAIAVKHALTEPEKAIILSQIAQSLNGNPSDCTGTVYIGDGPTDLFAMEYVKSHGGTTIMVHLDPTTEPQLDETQRSLVDYLVPVDYRSNSELARIINSFINQ